MYEPRHYDSPPFYSPPYSTTSQSFYPPRRAQSQHASYTYQLPPDYMEDKPQLFYLWFSPPGFFKTLQGVATLMCFLIFACVASTLVWDMGGLGYGVGATGGSGYYGGSYGYSSSYMTPQSAKAAMLTMASINFVVSLGFLVASFSRSPAMRGRRFYLTAFICDIILAILQGIIDIIFVIGVNPTSQSSQSMLYNPMLRMCQNIQSNPSLSAGVGPGAPPGLPLYNQYLMHYCYMDPEEAVGLVLGLMVVLALSLAAYYAYKTRSKIWRHGKDNIYWDRQPVRSEVHDVQDWRAPTVVVSERAAVDLRTGNGSYSNGPVSSEGVDHGSVTKAFEGAPQQQNNVDPLLSRTSTDESDSLKKPHHHHSDGERKPAVRENRESQCETGYTTGGDTGNELDQDHSENLFGLFPEIISDQQRQQYKREFDSTLERYKRLCEDMDDISDQKNKLSRELDTLDPDSRKYQGVADEYNRLKELKKTPDYQGKKKESKELRQKLFHIKRLVKNYDRGLC